MVDLPKQYNYCLDFIKGIACIFVVFLHCEFPGIMGVAVQAISRYCVPLFFMVSGYYYLSPKTLNVDERRRKVWHICKITVWASLFYIIFGIIQTMLSQSQFEPLSIKKILAFIGLNQMFFIVSQMWFLYALLYVYVALLFINQEWYRRNSGKIALVCLILYLFLAQGLHVAGISIPNYIYKNWLIEGMGFFSLGFTLHQYQQEIKINNNVLIAVFITTTIFSLFERYFLGRDFGVNIFSIPQVTALMICAIKNPLKHEGLIQRLGRDCSMMVYILHPAVWHSFEGLYEKMSFSESLLAMYIMPMLVLIFSILFSMLFNVFKSRMSKRNLMIKT